MSCLPDSRRLQAPSNPRPYEPAAAGTWADDAVTAGVPAVCAVTARCDGLAMERLVSCHRVLTWWALPPPIHGRTPTHSPTLQGQLISIWFLLDKAWYHASVLECKREAPTDRGTRNTPAAASDTICTVRFFDGEIMHIAFEKDSWKWEFSDGTFDGLGLGFADVCIATGVCSATIPPSSPTFTCVCRRMVAACLLLFYCCFPGRCDIPVGCPSDVRFSPFCGVVACTCLSSVSDLVHANCNGCPRHGTLRGPRRRGELLHLYRGRRPSAL